MTDYKKAFDLILRKAEFKAVVEIEGKRFNIGNKPKEFTNPTLTKEEYECIMKCANAESDSMDKIIEELEYKTCYRCTVIDTPYNIDYVFEHNGVLKVTLHVSKTAKRDYWLEPNGNLSYYILGYINRILRLWGVEI